MRSRIRVIVSGVAFLAVLTVGHAAQKVGVSVSGMWASENFDAVVQKRNRGTVIDSLLPAIGDVHVRLGVKSSGSSPAGSAPKMDAEGIQRLSQALAVLAPDPIEMTPEMIEQIRSVLNPVAAGVGRTSGTVNIAPSTGTPQMPSGVSVDYQKGIALDGPSGLVLDGKTRLIVDPRTGMIYEPRSGLMAAPDDYAPGGNFRRPGAAVLGANDVAMQFSLKVNKSKLAGEVFDALVDAVDKIEDTKVTESGKVEFTVYKKVGNIRAGVTYKGEMTGTDTMVVQRYSASGGAYDKNRDGSPVTLTFRRIGTDSLLKGQ